MDNLPNFDRITLVINSSAYDDIPELGPDPLANDFFYKLGHAPRFLHLTITEHDNDVGRNEWYGAGPIEMAVLLIGLQEVYIDANPFLNGTHFLERLVNRNTNTLTSVTLRNWNVRNETLLELVEILKSLVEKAPNLTKLSLGKHEFVARDQQLDMTF